MEGWFSRSIVQTGRLPLFFFFVSFLAAFLFIRFSVRMIRAGVRWWPGNITPGGLHIHHMVFGVVIMLVGGVAALTVPDSSTAGRAGAGATFGVGSALVLDEFALILRLKDVYWTAQGRVSVDAVFIALALSGMLLLGAHPLSIGAVVPGADPHLRAVLSWAAHVTILVNVLLAGVTLFKGKVATGLSGLFLPLLLWVGAIRLARPGSPWARWRYPPGSAKLATARRREKRLRRLLTRRMDRLSDLIAGRPDRSGS